MKSNTKFKLLRFGHCYINDEGDFIIIPLGGNRKRGYSFAASHAHPSVLLTKIHLDSRIVINDGRWTEISANMFGVVATFHSASYKVKLPKNKNEELPVLQSY